MWIKPGLYSHESNWEKRKREAEKKKKEEEHKKFANTIANIFAQIPSKPTQEERV